MCYEGHMLGNAWLGYGLCLNLTLALNKLSCHIIFKSLPASRKTQKQQKPVRGFGVFFTLSVTVLLYT